MRLGRARLANVGFQRLNFAGCYEVIEGVRPGLNGTVTGYIARRFVPQPARFQVIGEHTVIQSERLDNIAAKYLGDPTLFWRLCDANNAMRPDTLTATPGRVLDITMPQNVNGSPL